MINFEDLQVKVEDIIKTLKVAVEEVKEIEAARVAAQQSGLSINDRETKVYKREVKVEQKEKDTEAQKKFLEELNDKNQGILDKTKEEKEAIIKEKEAKKVTDEERKAFDAEKALFETRKNDREKLQHDIEELGKKKEQLTSETEKTKQNIATEYEKLKLKEEEIEATQTLLNKNTTKLTDEKKIWETDQVIRADAKLKLEREIQSLEELKISREVGLSEQNRVLLAAVDKTKDVLANLDKKVAQYKGQIEDFEQREKSLKLSEEKDIIRKRELNKLAQQVVNVPSTQPLG